MALADTALPFDDIRALARLTPERSGAALNGVRERDRQLTKPPGSLGRLEEIATDAWDQQVDKDERQHSKPGENSARAGTRLGGVDASRQHFRRGGGSVPCAGRVRAACRWSEGFEFLRSRCADAAVDGGLQVNRCGPHGSVGFCLG